MPTDNANALEDLDNVNIDASQIYLGVAGAEHSLGFTAGGVDISIEDVWIEMKVDRFGEQPINMQLSGRRVVIKATLAEVNVDTISAALAGSEVIVDGAKKLLAIGSGVGLNARRDGLALSLVIKPVEDNVPTDDENLWKRFPSVVQTAKISLMSDGKTQQGINVEFVCLPDDFFNLAYFGDETATVGS